MTGDNARKHAHSLVSLRKKKRSRCHAEHKATYFQNKGLNAIEAAATKKEESNSLVPHPTTCAQQVSYRMGALGEGSRLIN